MLTIALYFLTFFEAGRYISAAAFKVVNRLFGTCVDKNLTIRHFWAEGPVIWHDVRSGPVPSLMYMPMYSLRWWILWTPFKEQEATHMGEAGWGEPLHADGRKY